MKDRAKVWGIFLIFLVIVSFAHLFVHMAFYGTGVDGFAEKGISGFAVESEKQVGNLPVSEFILFMEWALIFLGVMFVYAKHRIDLRREFNDLRLLKDKAHFGDGTELDNFYILLQEVKHFRLSTAAKVFEVDVEVIEDWAKSLESSKVAELTYPRIGGPEIRLRLAQIEVQEEDYNNLGSKKVEKKEEAKKSQEEPSKNIDKNVTEKNKTVK